MSSTSRSGAREPAPVGSGIGPQPDPDDPTAPKALSPRRHDLALYLLVAFLVSWLPWPLVALNPDSSPMVPFGPLVGAVVAVAVGGGRRGLGQLLTQLTRWRRSPAWYVVALLVPVATTGLAAGLTLLLGGSGEVDRHPDWALVAATFVSTLLLIGLFEEVGWRGYALPRLQQRMSGLRAALLLGGIWALWHLPELVSEPTGQRPVVPFVVIVLAQSVFLAWLYNRTRGGLPLVMLSHGSIDTVGRFVLPGFVDGSYLLVWWCQAAIWSAAAILVAVRSGPGLGQPRPGR